MLANFELHKIGTEFSSFAKNKNIPSKGLFA
jgi:hypothetical protein